MSTNITDIHLHPFKYCAGHFLLVLSNEQLLSLLYTDITTTNLQAHFKSSSSKKEAIKHLHLGLLLLLHVMYTFTISSPRWM